MSETSDMFPDQGIDLTQQIKCVEREIAMRLKVYPRWVQRGKMQQQQATYELAAMGAVLNTLKAFRDGKTPDLEHQHDDPARENHR